MITNKKVTAGKLLFDIPDQLLDRLVGVEAEGAIPNGNQIIKVLAEGGDLHGIGAMGIVLGSHAIDMEDGRSPVIGYIVAWDDLPGRLGFVLGFKIREVETDEPTRTNVAH